MNHQQNIDIIDIVYIRRDRFDFILLTQLFDNRPGRFRLLALPHHHLSHITCNIVTHDRQGAHNADLLFLPGHRRIDQVAYIIFEEILTFRREKWDRFFHSKLCLHYQAEEKALLLGNREPPQAVLQRLLLIIGERPRVYHLQLDHPV